MKNAEKRIIADSDFIESKKFRDIRTGEIVSSFNILEIHNFEEVH